MNEERLISNNFGTMSAWKEKKRNTLRFVDEGSNNWNERERERGIKFMEWINREEWRRKIKF